MSSLSKTMKSGGGPKQPLKLHGPMLEASPSTQQIPTPGAGQQHENNRLWSQADLDLNLDVTTC